MNTSTGCECPQILVCATIGTQNFNVFHRETQFFQKSEVGAGFSDLWVKQ